MWDSTLKSIKEANFRANRGYELVLFDRLSSEQRAVLNGVEADPNLYGILQPRAPSVLRVKAVCHETALLYLTLQQAGSLPAYVQAKFDERRNQEIAELVLDGVLEVEREGAFVSGAEAYPLIYWGEPQEQTGGIIPRLSVEALMYAQSLEIDEAAKLSARIYFYNRIPFSPRWRRSFPTEGAVARHLGIEPGGSNETALARGWSKVSGGASGEGWHLWKSRRAQRETQAAGITYKLYVSPGCDQVREAFGEAVAALVKSGAICLKVGRDVFGLLRPDKIVAYFYRLEELLEVAEELRRKLEGCPAHGVTFTAEIGEDGLLSWGMDPPLGQAALVWQERESWRLWVTNRLAMALLDAKSGGASAVEPWRFALERLRLEGVDTRTWTPANTIWDEEPSTQG